MARSRLLLALLAAIGGSACGIRLELPSPRPPATNAPILLVTEGSAFAHARFQRQVIRSLERAMGRRVVLARDQSRGDTRLRALADKLGSEHRAIAKYDWREPACSAKAPIVQALDSNAEGVLRVVLDYESRVRPATDAELARGNDRPGRLRSAFGALRLATLGTVVEERVSGRVTLIPFTRAERSRSMPVSRSATHLEPTAFTPRLNAGAAVAATMRELPALVPPEWEGFARRLVSSGCPFLALAVCDARRDCGRGRRSVEGMALAAMQRSLGKVAAKQLAKETGARVNAALRAGNLDAAESILDNYQADPASQPDTLRELSKTVESARQRAFAAAASSEDGAKEQVQKETCGTLCGMHMVEICNNDKALWNSHRTTWQATPCGARRQETFLEECYRQQWLSGTFHDACVQPCEATAEGRERLMSILRGAGCLRPRPPTLLTR